MSPEDVLERCRPVREWHVFAIGVNESGVTVASQQRRALHLVDALIFRFEHVFRRVRYQPPVISHHQQLWRAARSLDRRAPAAAAAPLVARRALESWRLLGRFRVHDGIRPRRSGRRARSLDPPGDRGTASLAATAGGVLW
jgi:hypothetical protein